MAKNAQRIRDLEDTIEALRQDVSLLQARNTQLERELADAAKPAKATPKPPASAR